MDEDRGSRRTFTEEIELAGTRLVARIKGLVAEGNIQTAHQRLTLAQRLFPANRQLRALNEEIGDGL